MYVLGVKGTYEGEGSSTSNIKIFNTVDEMNASTDNADGDIALVYGINPVEPSSADEGFTANALILPDKIPTDLGITEDVKAYAIETNDDYWNSFSFTYPAERREAGFDLDAMANRGGCGISVYVGTSNGATSEEYYERKYRYVGAVGSILFLNQYFSEYFEDEEWKVIKMKVSDENSPLWDYIKFCNIDTIELYHYDGVTGTWRAAPNSMNTEATNLAAGSTMLGGKGLVEGTLDLTAKDKFAPIPYRYFYDNENLDITRQIMQKITPAEGTESLGDKRYCMVFSSMMGDLCMYSFWVADDSEIKYVTLSDEGTYYYFDPYQTSNKAITKYRLGHSTKLNKNFYSDITLLELASLGTLYDLTDDTSCGDVQTPYGICTNMEIRDEEGNVLVPEGPSAANTPIGSWYYNIFGEQVEGTMEITNAD